MGDREHTLSTRYYESYRPYWRGTRLPTLFALAYTAVLNLDPRYTYTNSNTHGNWDVEYELLPSQTQTLIRDKGTRWMWGIELELRPDGRETKRKRLTLYHE